MQISADFVHARMPFSDDELPPETFDSHLVVSITAPDDPSGPRPRLGIIPVLDKTGSMSHANKLTTAKAAISHLCGFLTGCVLFTSHVLIASSRELPVRPV